MKHHRQQFTGCHWIHKTLRGHILSLMIGSFFCNVQIKAAESLVNNLIDNPSFETPDTQTKDQPSGFIFKATGKTPDGNGSWEKMTHTGDRSVAIQTFASDNLCYWETIVPVKPSTRYDISFYYKCKSTDIDPTTVKGDPDFNKVRPGGPNLELGVVPTDRFPKPGEAVFWTDIGLALGPVGGVYFPLTTEWAYARQSVTTLPGQDQMKLKLRLYGYAQKVWFDDLSVVELTTPPKIEMAFPSSNAVLNDKEIGFRWKGPKGIQTYLFECSPTPNFTSDTTTLLKVQGTRIRLQNDLDRGRWFWRVGVADNHGLPCWIATDTFQNGNELWTKRDTTPPSVSLPCPPPNSEKKEDEPVSAKFNDIGSGIDLASARIVLDGKDVSSQATVTSNGFTLKPTALAKGEHQVRVQVSDKVGNVGNPLNWRFGVGQSLRNVVKIVGRKIYLNDEPYFPIGIYAYVCHPADGRFNEKALSAASDAGFDCVCNTTETKAGLDMLQKHGMKGFLNISNEMNGCGDPASAKVAMIEKGQVQFKDHPSTLLYWADDPEQAKNGKVEMVNARAVLKECDPDHPLLWSISDLPKLREAMETGDILSSYRYPVQTMHPQLIYGHTLNYVSSVVKDKPIFFNSQGYDLGRGAAFHSKEGYRPTVAEMRAMAYYSLIIGIDGYSLYACNSPNDRPELWTAALKMATEFRYLSPVLAGGKRIQAASLKSDSSSGSIYYCEIEHDGNHCLIAVNMSEGRLAATWELKNPIAARVLFEDRRMLEKLNAISDIFNPYESHVYQW